MQEWPGKVEKLTCTLTNSLEIFLHSLLRSSKCTHILLFKNAKTSYLFFGVLVSELSIGTHPVLIVGNARQWKRSVLNSIKFLMNFSFSRMCNGFLFCRFSAN
jgi:hypothetical protein